MTIPTENHMPCEWPLCTIGWTVVDLEIFNPVDPSAPASVSRQCVELKSLRMVHGRCSRKDRCRFVDLRRRIFQVNPCLHESILSGLKELGTRSNGMQLSQNGVGLVPKVASMRCVRHKLFQTCF